MRARQAEWATAISPEEVAELEAAADAALAAGRPLEELTDAAAFPLPRLAPRLAAARAAAVSGRGFALLRGLPVGRWSRRRAVAASWVVGLHWGSARSTNARGHLVGHVTDTGADPAAPETRLYATAAAQPFHNDGARIRWPPLPLCILPDPSSPPPPARPPSTAPRRPRRPRRAPMPLARRGRRHLFLVFLCLGAQRAPRGAP
jgi:hypothetical protein